MNKKQPKLKFEEDKERTATRSPPKKEKVEQTQPRKKLKLDADKAAEKAQHCLLLKPDSYHLRPPLLSAETYLHHLPVRQYFSRTHKSAHYKEYAPH